MRSAVSLSLMTLAVSSVVALGAGCSEPGDAAVESQSSAVTAVFSPLTLSPGWSNAPFTTAPAASALADGFVYLRGAVATTGTNPQPFVLPVGRRPSTVIYLPVGLCNSVKGRLQIGSDGSVVVSDRDGVFSAARCFTSLEGVSFPVSNAAHTALALQNGWANAGGVGRTATAKVLNGIVHLAGALNTFNTNPVAFTMPVGMRPAADVYTPVDLCNGNKGRLNITANGTVTVQAENGAFANAQCFTSLEGVTYTVSNAPADGWTCLGPSNGWVGMPFNTRNVCAKNVDGIIRLAGAVGTTGTNPAVFTLPIAMRPAANVYAAIDLCGATVGRIVVTPAGQVSVQTEGSFSNAQCFSSFEGASFSR